MSEEQELTDYLNNIIIAITDIKEFHLWHDLWLFAGDKKTINAVIRSLEVLGEATKHIPPSFRKKYPDIPWNKMAGMRDVLFHDYMGIDLMTVWKVSRERLPELKSHFERLNLTNGLG
jgi:uncharacterized protein with HEPN domain